MRVSKDFED